MPQFLNLDSVAAFLHWHTADDALSIDSNDWFARAEGGAAVATETAAVTLVREGDDDMNVALESRW